ncbi:hypothetical protein E9228_002954 [Curtobacterium flaccumfaciens]|uniref:Uncharacterized protein n=1 Tax=Curtobacterium salicis TaxID=1779862 RepID=A0ABX0T9X0_9MICO|nr:hypothetical protein [Curtobacterium sp. WW7]NII42296.1 hypothetical protein [Curtobacterium sp. WW7]
MAGSIRVELNSAGVVALLQSEEIKAELLRRGEAIQAAAGGAPDFDVIAVTGRQRAAVYVATASVQGMLAEATDRTLTRALDAGRS